jgi:2-keto-4-pentenoate hydratase/2-oxohepta-3-ene-1,7-dioic acid hydratase in catechol pathway
MKLATFATDGKPELGVVDDGDQIISLSRAAPKLDTTMMDLIGRWQELEGEVRRVASSNAPRLPLTRVRLQAPIARPGKILAIGMNYADHVAEMGRQLPTEQVWFCKQPTAVNGPYDPIVLPKVSDMVDWEVELVVVIGRKGRHISKADAPKHVFGYCAGNDVSVRDWQNATPQWMLGKSFDTHAPFGPWITTSDEAGDPHTLGVRCFVNDQKRQDSNTRNLVFSVWDQIAHVSKVMTLEPGDLLYTGTPGGVGMGMKPPVFLKPGDKVRVEIDKLGTLDQLCVAED